LENSGVCAKPRPTHEDIMEERNKRRGGEEYKSHAILGNVQFLTTRGYYNINAPITR